MAAPRLHVDPDRLLAAYEAAGSLADMMRRLGINPGSIAPARRLVQDAGLPYPAEHWGISLAPPSMPEDVTTDAQLIAYLETKGYELRTEPQRDDREYAYDVDTLDGTGTFSLGIDADPKVAGESLEDAFRDVLGYAAIALAWMANERAKTPLRP